MGLALRHAQSLPIWRTRLRTRKKKMNRSCSSSRASGADTPSTLRLPRRDRCRRSSTVILMTAFAGIATLAEAPYSASLRRQATSNIEPIRTSAAQRPTQIPRAPQPNEKHSKHARGSPTAQ